MARRTANRLVATRPAGFAVPRYGISAGMSGGATYGQGVVGYRMRAMRGGGMVRAQAFEENQYSRLSDINACRTAYRVNPVFRRLVNAEVENIVATGFRVMPQTADRGWNAAMRQYLDERYSTAHFAFPNLPGRSEWGCHMLACFHHVREGGVFVYRSSRGVQMFEEAQCGTPYERIGDAMSRDGLQFAADGTLAGFWIGEYSAIDGTRNETAMHLVPAFIEDERFGRLSVTSYLGSGGWVSGLRAVAPLACVIDDLERFADYYDAVSERAAQEACVEGVFKTNRKNAKQVFNVGRNGQVQDATIDDEYSNAATREPGTVLKIKPDEDYKVEALHTPGNNFTPFTNQSLRLVGIARAMPLEVLMMQFDGNFSASKGAVEMYHTACRMAKKQYVEDWSVPNYRMAVYQAVIDGDMTFRADWWRAAVIPSGWRSLDEAKEIRAALDSVERGLTSLTYQKARLFDRTPEDDLNDITETLATIREIAARDGVPYEELKELYFSNPYGPNGSKTAKARAPAPAPVTGGPQP